MLNFKMNIFVLLLVVGIFRVSFGNGNGAVKDVNRELSDVQTNTVEQSCILPDGKCTYSVYLNTGNNCRNNLEPVKNLESAPPQLKEDPVLSDKMSDMMKNLNEKTRTHELSISVNERVLNHVRNHIVQTIKETAGENAIRDRKLADLENAVRKLERENTESLQQDNLRLMSTILNGNRKAHDLHDRLNVSQHRAKHFENIYNSKVAEYVSLRNEKTADAQTHEISLENVNMELNNTRENFEKEKENLDAKFSQFRLKLVASEEMNNFKASEIASLQNALEESRSEVNVYHAEVNASNIILDGCRTDLNKSYEDTEHLRAELKQCQTTVHDLNDRVNHSKIEIPDMTKYCPANRLTTIDKPEYFSLNPDTQGYWGQDPLSSDGAIWSMSGYDNEKTLVKFRNRQDFANNVGAYEYALSEGCNGAQHNVYGGHFYCADGQAPLVNVFDLSTNPPELTGRINLAQTPAVEGHTSNSSRDPGYRNICPYLWGGFSDIDVEVDEYGVWIIYGVGEHHESCSMALAKVDTDSLQIENVWYFDTERIIPKWVGNAFMVCGQLYVTNHPHRQPTFVQYTFNTNTDKFKEYQISDPNIIFYPNKFNYNAHLHYNPQSKELYAWENAYQLKYRMKFEK